MSLYALSNSIAKEIISSVGTIPSSFSILRDHQTTQYQPVSSVNSGDFRYQVEIFHYIHTKVALEYLTLCDMITVEEVKMG